MAKLEEYAYPGFGLDWDNLPSGFDHQAHWREESDRLEALRKKGNESDTLKGFVWSCPVADGYANYIVTKLRPLTLQYINFGGDGYAVPEAHIRGLKKEDLDQAKGWARLWVSR